MATSDTSESKTPNYHAIEPPHDRVPSEYTTDERRAEVLEFVISKGGPTHVNQTRLADRYDVAQSTISRDIDVLGEAVAAQLGDHLKLATRALHDRLVTDLSEDDDWRAKKAAWDVHRDYLDWVGVSVSADETEAPPNPSDHELTEQQRQHLDDLREWADSSIPKRESSVTVPGSDGEA